MWRLRAFSIVACLALPAWGGPLWTPKNWFFERFYMIKSNWKSSSLFCLLFPLASYCRTLPWNKWKNVLPVCIRDLTGSISAPIRFVSWGTCWIRCVPKSIFRIGKNILCMNLSDSMYVVLSSNSWCPMKIVTTPIPYSMYLGSIIYLKLNYIHH